MKKSLLIVAALAFAGLTGTGIWKLSGKSGPATDKSAAAPDQGGKHGEEENEKEEPYDQYLEWEMAMLRDPATGRIPVGIREQENALKLQLRAEQALHRSPESNSYEFVGPSNKGGRTRSVVYDKRDDNIVLAGGVSGGVFRSTNGGATWTRVSSLNEPADVTCIVQDPRAGHEDTWYYSTGNGGRGNSASYDGGMYEEVAYYLGSGIYKSIDNGVTWVKITGSNETGQLEVFDKHMDLITRIAVHPTTGDIYIAASGAIYRGHYGYNIFFGWFWSWSKVLGNGAINYYTMTDVAINSSGTIYAALSGLLTDGYDGVWKSSTGNLNDWTQIAGNGSPSGWYNMGQYGRVVLAIPPSAQNQLWVAFYNSNIKNSPPPNVKLFKYSYNAISGIGTWTNKSSLVPASTESYTGYALCLGVKPDNSNHIYLGTISLCRIIDGASPTSESMTIPHSDIQWIGFKPTLANKPNNKDTMILGCDGGVHRAFIPTAYPAGSLSWINMNKSYATIQYYFCSISQSAASTIQYVGGTQDNHTTVYKTSSNPYDHLDLTGGDGFQCYVDNANSFAYTSSQWGDLYRNNFSGGYSEIDPTVATWDDFRTYYHMNPAHNNVMFYADFHTLYRTNSANTATASSGWTALTGCTFEYWDKDFPAPDAITAMATTSEANPTLFIGTMHGKIERLTNSKTATASSYPTLLPTSTNMAAISDICVDPSNNNNVMFTVSSYNYQGVYYSTNALSASPTWTGCEGNIPLPSFRSCKIVNGPTGTEYYVGTSVGLFKTTLLNGSSTVWTQESTNLIGDAVITSLTYRPSDYTLLIGTHGNGMYKAVLGGGGRIDGSAQADDPAPGLNLFPNPLQAGQAGTITCYSTSEKQEVLEVFDMSGKRVLLKEMTLEKGANKIPVEFNLQPGVYIARVGKSVARFIMER